MEGKKLQSVAFDLSPDFASAAYLEEGERFPITMSMCADDEKYVIPMVLYKKRNIDEWLIGDEAVFASENEASGKENLIENIFQIYAKGEVTYIEEKEYSGEELLKRYIKTLYAKAKSIIEFLETKRTVFTMEKLDARIVSVIRQVCEELGIDKQQLSIIGHAEAFVYYVISSKKELWANDVTLFSMDKTRFFCQTITMRKEKSKSTIFVEEEDLSGLVKYSQIKSEKYMKEADEQFCQYLREDYRTHIVSSRSYGVSLNFGF